MLQRISDGWSRAEAALAGLGALVVTGLIMFNVISRALNMAVYWVDEAAIYVMIWMTFFATSVLLKRRGAVAVTVMVDFLPQSARRVVGMLIDWSVLAFGALLFYFCWGWFDLPALWRSGWDVDAFAAETMNFIYQEKPNTLPMAKFWVWLIVPVFALSVVVHALANIVSDPRGRYMDATQREVSA